MERNYEELPKQLGSRKLIKTSTKTSNVEQRENDEFRTDSLKKNSNNAKMLSRKRRNILKSRKIYVKSLEELQNTYIDENDSEIVQ